MLFLLSATPIFSSTSEFSKPSYASPSDLMMYLLKKGTTIWRGSADWKKSIESIKQGQVIKLVYAASNTGSTLIEYQGCNAHVFRLSHKYMSSKNNVPNRMAYVTFEVSLNKDECIEIAEHFVDIETVRPVEKSADEMREIAVKHDKKMSEQFSDNWVKCTVAQRATLDEKAGTLQTKITHDCKSVIPLSIFMQALKKTDRK